MSRVAWMAVVAAIAVGACGYPNFVFDGTTGTGAHGGATSSTTTTTTTTTTSAGGGAGGTGPTCKMFHQGGGSCEYMPGHECGCSAPTPRCTVVDPTSGATACVSAGTTADYDACMANAACRDGSWCDLTTLVCEPICSGTCSSGGVCLPALQGSDVTSPPIPSLHVCSASCDLVSAAPCGQKATCVVVTDTQGDTGTACFASGQVQDTKPCAHPQDCLAGLACLENSSGSMSACEPWCSVDDGCLPPYDSLFCNAFDPPFYVGSTEYGFCE